MQPNADMVPKDCSFNQSENLPLMCDVVHACWQRQEMVNLHKCSIFVITETQFAIQTQVK